MYSKRPGKNSKGSVGVESFQGRLRLRLPRELFNGKQKYLSLGLPDTDINRRIAEAKANLIEADIRLERFDYTLAKYGKQQSQAQLTVVETLKGTSMSIAQLWARFFEHKRSSLKPKTVEKYENLAILFDKLDGLDTSDALAVKKKLEDVTTIPRTKDGLMYISAACKWGVKHKLISSNPFEGMSQEMPQHKYITNPNPNAFSEEEREAVIEAFKNDRRKGMNYQKYAPFVEFLFLTGCRPSEAVGLRWKHISEDCASVSFEGALVQVRNKRVPSKGSKNNKVRKLSISSRVQSLLQSIKPEQANPEDLVFPSPDGGSINYRNFSRRAWSNVVKPIKPKTTPYCCRDTFITSQLLKGVPSAVIAKWCDTSTQMIDKNYADKLKLSQMRPMD
ncbi:MAG: tyrosine-type recombinase/integrase [Leptolyngbyaceae cyanobacterium bins.349]|nr:tyrosine-type recombinase/integrase [Leptolyngbyaceae cyanobacterium bins.349]